MAIENESDKSKELLLQRPNPFSWEGLGPNMTKHYRDHINSNPYNCDGCCDTYNKDDLYKVKSEWFCKNCLCSG